MTGNEQVASVRYIVDDVRAALDFYTTQLGFVVHANPAGNLVEVFEAAAH